MLNQVLAKSDQLKSKKVNDILNRSKKKLVKSHRKWAIQKYKTFKNDQSLANVEAAIDQFQKVEDIAEEYDNTKKAKEAKGIITKLMYQRSLVQYQQSKLQEALNTLNEVIDRNSNYALAYYQKGIIVKNMDSKNFEKSIKIFDEAIKIAEKTGNSQVAEKSRGAARNQLVVVGSGATEDHNYSEAVDILQRALSYDSKSAKAHYRLAEAYNKMQQWGKAISSAQKGLDYENGGKTDKAKIYFELGTAYQGMGKKGESCSAFDNAAYGQFKRKANYIRKNELECEGTS